MIHPNLENILISSGIKIIRFDEESKKDFERLNAYNKNSGKKELTPKQYHMMRFEEEYSEKKCERKGHIDGQIIGEDKTDKGKVYIYNCKRCHAPFERPFSKEEMERHKQAYLKRFETYNI